MSTSDFVESAAARDPGDPGQGSALPLDVGVLAELIGDDPEVIGEFLRDFHDHMVELAARIRTAFHGGEAGPLGIAAHMLKSSARSVGALGLGEICADIERRSKQDDALALLALQPRFETEIASIDAFLRSKG